MNDLVLTPGPWGWRQPAGSREINLCTVGRGMLYVLSPARAGMNGATIRFGHRTAADRGGLLKEVPVRPHGAPDYLRADELTPDARLIQAAPVMERLLRRVVTSHHRDMLVDEIVAVLAEIRGCTPRPDLIELPRPGYVTIRPPFLPGSGCEHLNGENGGAS